ncbi:MAG: ATP-grasp domain-containing protein [Clostridium sp.]
MNVLSIGAGVGQEDFISKARSKGLYIVGIDGDKEATGKNIADEFYNIDIKEKSSVEELIYIKNIEGILPIPIGRYLTTTGYCNSKCGFKGISYKASKNCTDKLEANAIMKKNNINCANQLLCKNEKEVIDFINKFQLPVIVKPRYGSGSKRVEVVKNKKQLKKYFKQNDILIEDILMEEYLKGEEYGVDLIYTNLECRVLSFRRKVMTAGVHRQEIGYYINCNRSNEYLSRFNNEIIRIAKIFQLSDCFIHMDVMIKNDEIYLIEVSGRPAGLDITSQLLPLAYNRDIYGDYLDYIFNGKPMNFDSYKMEGVYYLRYIDLENGILKEAPSSAFLSEVGVVKENLLCKVGQCFGKIKDGRELYTRGYVIIKGKDEAEVDESWRKIKNKFKVI